MCWWLSGGASCQSLGHAETESWAGNAFTVLQQPLPILHLGLACSSICRMLVAQTLIRAHIMLRMFFSCGSHLDSPALQVRSVSLADTSVRHREEKAGGRAVVSPPCRSVKYKTFRMSPFSWNPTGGTPLQNGNRIPVSILNPKLGKAVRRSA